MSPLRSPILLCNGKANFFIDQKVLLIFFFYCAPSSSTSAPKNKSKHRALFSECGGAYGVLLWDR